MDSTSKMQSHHRLFSCRHWVQTGLDGWFHRNLFSNLNAFVLFAGYPRSGHTLVATHMTAHPEMVISHELHALQYFQLGYRKHQLFRMIQRRDDQFASLGCQNGKYNYHVPGQWQGRFGNLTVIGDKKGAGSTKLLARDPKLLNRFRKEVGMPVRTIHVVRNPFDTISRIRIQSGQPLEQAIRRYFKLVNGMSAIIRENPDDVLTVHHESYVDDPPGQLAAICRFVGVRSPDDYLNDCAATVFSSPRLTRQTVQWRPELVGQVNALKNRYSYLVDYEFYDRLPSTAAA